jgi:hypothetical protein
MRSYVHYTAAEPLYILGKDWKDLYSVSIIWAVDQPRTYALQLGIGGTGSIVSTVG